MPMKTLVWLRISIIAILAAGGTFLLWPEPQESVRVNMERGGGEARPHDWFYLQRSYPFDRLNTEAYAAAAAQARRIDAFAKPGIAGEWELAGPLNVGGRITSIAVPLSDTKIIYAGSATGGLFKSEDDGNTWRAIFDEQPSLSIGDVTVDPKNPDIVYVGTGEANGMRITYPGAGVFKSTDGGESWRDMGLEGTYAIGRVTVDPNDSRRIFVAAMGDPFNPNTTRGLFRSTDAGESWERVLSGNDSTGCIDIVMHAARPNTIYAALWERRAKAATGVTGGMGSGIFKSTDGGDSWGELTVGLPENRRGRIGIAISPSDPRRLYAIYADSTGSFLGTFRTHDEGESWGALEYTGLSPFFYSSYGWWFGQIRVDPVDPGTVYILGIPLARSTNGGMTWTEMPETYHVDQHALFIDPADPEHMVLGNDGGIYITRTGHSGWRHVETLPITQFYTCEIDHSSPHSLYGGTQDNYTLRTVTGGPDQWVPILDGDGFHVIVDPTDSRYIYAEAQYGAIHRSTDGGGIMTYARDGINGTDRFNWNTPMVLDPSQPATLYCGSQRVYRSTNRAVRWNAISGDLSRGASGRSYGTVSTIAPAKSDPDVIYAGTDDGNVWVTMNGGSEWRLISQDLPLRWVTRVAVDPADARIAYVTFSGYRDPGGEYLPHIFRTTDAGASWRDISGNLPEAPVNDVIIDPRDRSLLMIATDFGVFYTRDVESGWQRLGQGLPNVPVNDLVLHTPTNKLVAATYGRSMYTLDITPLAAVDDAGASALALSASPNPSKAGATVSFSLAKPGLCRVEMFDIAGRPVRLLREGMSSAGEHRIGWNGEDDHGRKLPAGRYFCRVTIGSSIRSIPITLLR